MNALRGTALVLALAVVAGCGSNGTKDRRDAVNAYFGKLGDAQIALLSKEAQIDTTLQSFSLSRATPSELAQLRKVRSEVSGAYTAVHALHPPADARKLHRLVLQRLALQRSLVDELIATAIYIRKFAIASPPLGAAALKLRNDLAAIRGAPQSTGSSPTVPSGATTLDRYATAFGSYGVALEPVSAALAKLDAPPVMRPTLDAERHALTRSIALCATIRRTLGRRDIAGANAAIHSLFTVAADLNGSDTRKQQAEAARVYDKEIGRVDVLAKKINLERERLVRVIG